MWSGVHSPSNQFYVSQKWRAIGLASIVLIVVTYTLIDREKASPQSGLLKPDLSSLQSSVQFHPSQEFLNATDVIWQIPDSPNAALFIAHGCGVRASKYWDNYPSCPNCTGLPEERVFVLRALERRFAVLTVSSLGRCWTLGNEMENVKWIINWWIERNKLEKLPIVALGASSGGYFISALAIEMRFSSIAIMIAEGVSDAMAVAKSYPPTLFIYMPKDQKRMRFIMINMKILRQKGVPVSEIRCMEFPLTPSIFSDRIPGLTEIISVKLYNLFQEKQFIDENGYMKNDGRATNWKQALAGRNILPGNYGLLDHIEEELNLAFAYHEMTSLPSDEILKWFKSHMN